MKYIKLYKNKTPQIDFGDKPVICKIKANGKTYVKKPKYFIYKNKINDFLYEIKYQDIDYSLANEYFKGKTLSTTTPSCSSVRNGNFFGRNLDWLYDNHVDFVVRTTKTNTRHSSIGVAGTIPKMFVDSVDGVSSILDENNFEMYKILPFYLLDGVNDSGVFMNQNVVPLDNDDPTMATRVIEPLIEQRDEVCSLMLTRYVLDKFSSATEAVEYLRDYVKIYMPETLIGYGYQNHFMVGDNDITYVIEFYGGVFNIIEQTRMTNFYLTNVTFNSDGKVYTPQDVEENDENKPTTKNHITRFGSGLERYNLIVDSYDACDTSDGMRALMNSLLYSRAYKSCPDSLGGVANPYWMTEAVGSHKDSWYFAPEEEKDNPRYLITVDTKPSECTKVVGIMDDMFLNRDREKPQVWVTTHSCVYDIENKTLNIVSQENVDRELLFDLSIDGLIYGLPYELPFML